MALTAEIEESSVDRIIGSSDEGRLLGAEEQGQGGYFLRRSHSADGLRLFQLGKHLLLSSRVTALEKSIHEGSVYTRRRDAIATDVERQVVLRHRVGHRHYCPLAHGIGEAIVQSCRARDGSHVENDTAALGLHVRYGGSHAVVHALYVHQVNSFEILFCRAFQVAHMGDAGVVHQDVESTLSKYAFKRGAHAFRVRDVAGQGFGISTAFHNFTSCCQGCVLVNVEQTDTRAAAGESPRDGKPYAAGSSGNDRQFAI